MTTKAPSPSTLVAALCVGALLIIGASPWLAAQPGISFVSQTFRVGAAGAYQMTWPDAPAAGVLQSDATGGITIAAGLPGSFIDSGVIHPERLGTGTRDGTRFLRDDGQWQTAGGSGLGDITSVTVTAPLTGGGDTGDLTVGLTLAADDIPDLAAAKINAGTFDADRIPVLGTANVAALDASDTTTGTFGINRIPNLPATQITSGSFPLSVIPVLGTANVAALDAGDVTTGTFDADRIPGLDAAKITSGEFGTDRVAALDAGDVTTGTFGTARVANLAAGDVTTGTFAVDRIPNLPSSKITGTFGRGRLSISSGSANLTFNNSATPNQYGLQIRISAGGSGCAAVPTATGITFVIRNQGSQCSQGTVSWLYLAASDNPRLWVRRTAAGELVGLWESEDPPTDAVPEVSPLTFEPGTTTTDVAVSAGPPPVAVLAEMYAATPSAERADAMARLRAYLVDERDWLETFTAVSQLADVPSAACGGDGASDCEPAARLHALRRLSAARGDATDDSYAALATITALATVAADGAWAAR